MRFFVPTTVLFLRELRRFTRQPVRVASIVLAPFLYTLVVSSGIGAGVILPEETGAAGRSFAEWLFPSVLVLLVVSTALFAPASTVEDRREGFLQTVLVAPVSHASLVLCKILAGAFLGLLQTGVLLACAPLVGIAVGWQTVVYTLAALAIVGVAFCALGFLIAWWSESVHSFQAAVQAFVIPLWLLAGGIMPLPASSWLAWFDAVNPLFYAVNAVRTAFFGEPTADVLLSAGAMGCAVLALGCFVAGWLILRNRVRFNS